MFVRLFWFKSFTSVDLLKTVGSALSGLHWASASRLMPLGKNNAHAADLSELSLTAVWWCAFSISLYWSEISKRVGESLFDAHSPRALDTQHGISTDRLFLRIRNESSRLQASSCFCGVSMPSSANWKVPWWIAMLFLAPRISWARTASSGAMCTGDINQRGSCAVVICLRRFQVGVSRIGMRGNAASEPEPAERNAERDRRARGRNFNVNKPGRCELFTRL
jgi:hypothetical protein